jgi:subtilisin family serine protease
MNKSSRVVGVLCCCVLAGLLGGCTLSPSNDAQLAQTGDYSRYVIVTIRNQPAPAPLRAGASVRTYPGVADYAIAPATRHAAKAIAAAHGLRESAAWPIGLLGVHCVVFEIPTNADAGETIARLRRDRRVESVQPLQSFSTLGLTSTSAAPGAPAGDPYRKLQRNLDIMEVSEAHRWSRGEGVRVGVIDTGVDATHPDLAGRIVRQENLVGDHVAEASPDRHGTAVAGVIGAVGDNQRGIIGVAPAAELYALRACWPRPEDDARAACSSFTLAKALVAAIEARMQVVNLSLGGPADPLLTRIVDAGLKRGVVFIGATPREHPLESFPTNIRGVIAANESSADPVADATLLAPVLAPGRDVLTLAPGGRYDFMSGSSLAAASVSGGVALLLARDRTLTAEQARRLLLRSIRNVAAESGAPIASIDLCVALSSLVNEADCRP